MPNTLNPMQMQQMQYMNAPPDIQAGASEIFRQKQMADLLRKQSMEPVQADQYTKAGSGQWAAPAQIVPVSWAQGLGKLAQGAAAGYMDNQANEQQKALAGQLRTRRTAELGKVNDAINGSDFVPGQMTESIGGAPTGALYTDEGAALPKEDQEGVRQFGTPAKAPASNKELAALLMNSEFPDIAAQGMKHVFDRPAKDNTVVPAGSTVIGADGRVVFSAPHDIKKDNIVIPAGGTVLKPDGTTFTAPEKTQYENASNLEKEYEFAKKNGYKGDVQQWLKSKRDATHITVNSGATKTPMGYRVKPNGDLEPIPGGPADQKAEVTRQKEAEGNESVKTSLTTLRDAYDRLDSGGGITSTKKGAITNAGAAISSSGVGQTVGKMLGTNNQSARNDIAMSRPGLLAALMKATGMSSKQMDSNAELKLWLATATDPTLDVESNRKALDNIEKKYLNPKRNVTPSRESSGKIGESKPTVSNW